ncbi:glycosyltransferase family 2 protein [Pseudogemmobacter sonorensis]|uniref:glycosyltransferase family 2 protein n=1 Tax=Pseudogemmobacter sonorensis TaxID=2989681 RepID=UPI0036CCBBDC
MRILSVTAMRDEGPFVLEWLAWHRLLGVTDFLILTNDCRDGTDRLLDALAQEGVLTHLPNRPPEGKSIQWQALKTAWRHPARKAADWMLFSDVDEFPMIHAGEHRFADLLAALPGETQAVAMAWRLFGASGVVAFQDRPVTGQFLRSAPPEMLHPVGASYFKTLFRPEAFAQPGVHRPARGKDQAAAAWVDGSGRPLPEALAARDKRLSLLPLSDHRRLVELHHYSLRSVQSFLVKADRGLANRRTKGIDLHYWVERNFNTVENKAALALAQPLAAEIARLRTLPGVEAAHRAACDWHHAQARALLRQIEFYRLYCACLHASNSAALPDRLAASLLALYQDIDSTGA